MTCKRCGGTGTLVEYFEDPIYEWPPIKCEIWGNGNTVIVTCKPVNLVGWTQRTWEEFRPCPDCREEVIESEFLSLEELGLDPEVGGVWND